MVTTTAQAETAQVPHSPGAAGASGPAAPSRELGVTHLQYAIRSLDNASVQVAGMEYARSFRDAQDAMGSVLRGWDALRGSALLDATASERLIGAIDNIHVGSANAQAAQALRSLAAISRIVDDPGAERYAAREAAMRDSVLDSYRDAATAVSATLAQLR